MPVQVNILTSRTAPATYSPTLANSSGVASSVFKWYRDNLWLHIHGQVLFSAQGSASAFTLSLPQVFGVPLIDTTMLPGGSGTGNDTASIMGNGFWFDNGAGWTHLYPKFVSTSLVGFWANTQVWDNSLAAAGDALNFRISAPIVGWG